MAIDLHNFAETCKDRGFSIEQARLLLQERLVFGSTATDLYRAPCRQQDVDLPLLRRKAQEALDGVETPRDLMRYLAAWPDMAQSCTTLSRAGLKTWLAESALLDLFDHAQEIPNLVLRVSDASHGYWPPLINGSVEPLRYLAPKLKLSDDPWQRLSDQTTLLQGLADKTCEIILSDTDLPPPVDSDYLKPLSSDEVAPLGLTSLSLGWGVRVPTPHLLSALSRMNEGLQKRTGWPGPVLGLAGNLSLVIGSPCRTDGNTAAMTATLNAPRSRSAAAAGLTLFSGSGLESVPHEWFHAMDFVMAHAVDPHYREGLGSAHATALEATRGRRDVIFEFAKEVTFGLAASVPGASRAAAFIAAATTRARPRPRLMAWSALVDGLQAAAYSDPNAQDWRPIMNDLKKRYPFMAAALEAEAPRIQDGHWQMDQAHQRIMANLQRTKIFMRPHEVYREFDAVVTRACRELEAFGASRPSVPNARKKWFNLQQDFDRKRSSCRILLTTDRYWSSPEEIAARAFSQSMNTAGPNAPDHSTSEPLNSLLPNSALPRIDHVFDHFFTSLSSAWSGMSIAHSVFAAPRIMDRRPENHAILDASTKPSKPR